MKLLLMIIEALFYGVIAVIAYILISSADSTKQAGLFGIMFGVFFLLTSFTANEIQNYLRNRKKNNHENKKS